MKPQIFETDDLDSCLSLRRAVFIDEQGVPEAEEQDAGIAHFDMERKL